MTQPAAPSATRIAPRTPPAASRAISAIDTDLGASYASVASGQATWRAWCPPHFGQGNRGCPSSNSRSACVRYADGPHSRGAGRPAQDEPVSWYGVPVPPESRHGAEGWIVRCQFAARIAAHGLGSPRALGGVVDGRAVWSGRSSAAFRWQRRDAGTDRGTMVARKQAWLLVVHLALTHQVKAPILTRQLEPDHRARRELERSTTDHTPGSSGHRQQGTQGSGPGRKGLAALPAMELAGLEPATPWVRRVALPVDSERPAQGTR